MSGVSLTVDERGLARVVMDSPATRNALSPAALVALEARISEANDRRAHVIVLSGARGSFASGADLRELVERSEWASYDALAQRTFDAVERSAAPVIAVVDGIALGGALELALACHLRVASRTARLGFPEVGLGMMPGAGGTQRLAAIAGRGRAMDLILTARLMTGEEAFEVGIVTQAVDAEQLAACVDALGRCLLANAPNALRLAKDAVVLAHPAASGLAFERAAQALLFTQSARRTRVGQRIAQLEADRAPHPPQEAQHP